MSQTCPTRQGPCLLQAWQRLDMQGVHQDHYESSRLQLILPLFPLPVSVGW